MTEKINQEIMNNVKMTIKGMDSLADSYWKMWEFCMSGLHKCNQQMDEVARVYLDQNRKAITEGNGIMLQMAQGIRVEQKKMVEMLNEAVTAAFSVRQSENSVASYWVGMNRKWEDYLRNINQVA